MRKATGLCLLISVIFLSPAAAFGDWRQFIPRIFEYKGELEVYGRYESDKTESEGGSRESKQILINERLNLSATGFIYHPRFIKLNIRFSPGLKHTDFESGPGGGNWQTARSTEFELRARILPYHPYNLELFTMRVEPYTVIGGSASTPSAVNYSSGAIFKYKKKPYFASLTYTRDTNETSLTTAETNSYSASGMYLKQYARERVFEVSGFYHHVDSTSTNNTDTTSDVLEFRNTLKRDFIDLRSHFKYDTYDQTRNDTSLKFDKLNWDQRLFLVLPLNFRFNTSYYLGKAKFESSGPSSDTSDTTNTKGGEFTISHHLYRSLVTQFNMNYQSTDSDNSSSKMTSGILNVRYTKKIPWGLMTAGVASGSSHQERTGTVTVTDEPHPGIAVPGSFLLPARDLDPLTIRVSVKSPDPPFELIDLTKNIHYTVGVDPSGLLRININILPPELITPGTFDFSVSYSLTNGNTISDITTRIYDLRFDLFNNLVSPYYSHSEFTNDFSGDAPAQASFRTTDLVGLQLRKWDALLTVEHQEIKSDVDPSTSSRARLEYRKILSPTSNLYASAEYETTNFDKGSLLSQGIAYTEDTMKAQASITKGLFNRALLVTLGGNYQTTSSLNDSTIYGVNSGVFYRNGKTEVSFVADLNLTESTFAGGTERRTSQRYYLRLKRRLF